MSVFSEHLSWLIESRKVKIAALCKFCDVDRSTMYQYISGKRKVPVSVDLINKIAEFLHLTPVEYEKLKEAYLISKVGDEIYYRRQSVENFIRNFPDLLPTLSRQKSADSLQMFPKLNHSGLSCMPLTSLIDLNHYIHRIFLEESLKENGRISLFLQPDNHFLFELLSSLKPVHSLVIEQILCINSTQQMNDEKEMCSLEYLKRLFPLYVADLDYHPYYFYDNIYSHFENMNGMCCLILTSEYAITCTSDYQMGVLYGNPDVISMFWNLFESYKKKCSELFSIQKFLPENTEAFQCVISANSTCNILQSEPCLTVFITEDIIRHSLNPDVPDCEEFLSLVLKMFEGSREVLDGNYYCSYFTRTGLDHFVKQGRIREIPDIFYSPITISDRIKMLESLIPYCRRGNYRILKGETSTGLELPLNFHLCVNGHFGYLLFTNIFGQNVGLVIREHGLLEAFEDYLDHFDESYYISPEEAVGIIKEAIESLQKL